MKLKTVTIKNYRCFEKIEVNLDNTSVLIGENNSGKSSFIEAIRTCLSRGITRRDFSFEDYDYHLSSDSVIPQDCEELSIRLDFICEDNLEDEVVQSLGDILVYDNKEQRHIILQITSKYDRMLKDFISEWSFLDCEFNPLGPKTKRSQLINSFLQINPVFYLSALRDAAKEFSGRSKFWPAFLRNPNIPEDVTKKLQEEISQLNNEVLNSHPPLRSVKEHLAKIQNIVSAGGTGPVDIETLPIRIMDLLSKTQVYVASSSGARLPLERHGSGTQSLAVIFLFEAFLSTMITKQYDKYSRPLLTLEEPEAHLHPCAIRSLWNAIDAIDGQKIIATHSGDLLGRVPLTSIRRFYRKDGKIYVREIKENTLTPEELRKVNFHLRSSRGELLFARCWILGEGESEYWLFNGLADILGDACDLDQLGIRVISFQQFGGIEPFLKVANSLGIEWVFIGDGDSQGTFDKNKCIRYLNEREEENHIFMFGQPNIEVFLCESGFGEIYKNHISPQKRAEITEDFQANPREYWKQVVKAKDDTPKPKIIQEVIEQMRNDSTLLPCLLKKILGSAKKLSGQ